MYINEHEYSTFLLLQNNPLLKIVDIARNLKISFKLAKKSYESLFHKKLVSGIRATVSAKNLGLKRVFAFYSIPKYENVVILEKLLEHHNFTRYHTRYVSGNERGLYVSYDLPESCLKFLHELSTRLINKDLVSDCKILSTDQKAVTSELDVKYIDWESLSLNFNFYEWAESIQEDPLSDNKNLEKIESNFGDKKLNQVDAWILRVLTKDATLSNKAIKNEIKLQTKSLIGQALVKDASTISRRLKHVNANYIEEYKLRTNNDVFHLSSQILFTANASTEHKSSLYSKLVKTPLPFTSHYVETIEGFRWFIRCSTEKISQITNFLWKLGIVDLKMFYLIPDSKTYWFYPLNYDFNENKWIDNYHHFFDPVMPYLK